MNRQFELKRINRLLTDLKQLIITDQTELTDYYIKDSKSLSDAHTPLDDWQRGQMGTPWTELDSHRWFRTTIQIPEKMAGKTVVFSIVTGREDQWNGLNPQMLLYLDGRLVQAADVNHRELLITQCAEAGEEHEIAILAYSGTVPGDLILHTYLRAIDRRIRKLCYDIGMPLDTAVLLYESDEENCLKLIKGLAEAGDVLDLRVPYSDTFYESLRKAEAILAAHFYSKVNEDAPVVSAIGHTHIDIAWLWPVTQTREKALRSFSTVLSLMKQYPDYHFMSSQPILYQFVKEQDPDLYGEIHRRVKEGRWETDGAMWLEADCNLTGGESLVRQILMGHRFFKEEFGTESRTLWLPDAFGYSAALPQILKKSGITCFMTTKISWNQYNQLPNDMFMWRGIDGSEIFTYMPTASKVDDPAARDVLAPDSKSITSYSAIIDPNMTLGTHKRFQNHDLTENTLMLFGYGDGGGGPTAEMLENAERLKYGLPGLPRIQLEGEKEFFARTIARVKDDPNMPAWDGELYFEYHRGTLTSMAKNKRNNRKAEILLEQLETLASMAALAAHAEHIYPKETLEKAWHVIALNQFHDILPGTCIEEVYKNTDQEYAQILQLGQAELNKIVDKIVDHATAGEEKDALVVVNTLGYERSGLVKVPENIRHVRAFTDVSGRQYPVQYTGEGAIFYASGIPSVGTKKFYPVRETEQMNDRKQNAPEKFIWNGTYENAFYKAIFDEKMHLISLVEKSEDREYIPQGKAGNILCTYEDRPMNWDNWDIDEYYKRKPYEADWVSTPVVRETGDVETVIEYSLGFGDSTVTQKICFFKDLPRIDFKTKAEWNTHHVILRVNFPVDVNATRAAYEIQFGNVERETTFNQSWDSAKFEACGHKWADLSENNGGVSLLNDCKYGYGIKNGNLSMTLIKSGTYPNENADIGHHEFTYSIYPHSGRWQEARTIEMAYDLNVPLHASFREANRREAAAWPSSLLTCSRSNCFLEMIKQSEDGKDWIVRMYENHNSRVKATLTLGIPVKHVYECDLLENVQTELAVKEQHFETVFKPFEIKTFRICC